MKNMEILKDEYIDAEKYFAAPGLSNSMMKDLAISPLRMWHRWINPQREIDEPTAQMQFGTALHCAILEPDEFQRRFACEFEPPENCLDTMDDLRGFIRDKGHSPKGTRKDELIAQALTIDSGAQILALLRMDFAKDNEDKTVLSVSDWERVAQCEIALREQPAFAKLIESGTAEVALFGAEPHTNAPIKGRLDWVTPEITLDIKTFSQKKGKSIDKSVTDAIFYEQYYRQAYIYALLRGWPKTWNGKHVLAFVESDPPHEVRLRSLHARSAGEANLYWTRAALEVRDFCRTYQKYSERFGTEPWRDRCSIDALYDEEIPQLAW